MGSGLPVMHGTTILCVRAGGGVAMGGDGQVTLGDTVVKDNARKVRKLRDGKILAGFAGATADAFTLLDLFEKKLEKHQGQLLRAAVELSKEWRTDRILRRLEALLALASADQQLIVSGVGDVIEPDVNVMSVGSGANFARSAALALVRHTQLSAKEIVHESLDIASDICIYSNKNFTVETIGENGSQ